MDRQYTEKQLINKVVTMRSIILFLVLMISIQAHSQEVQCKPESINIQEGDVVSADVLNDIFTRINNIITGGIDTGDLVGTWQCTSTLRPGEASGIYNGYSQNNLGLFTVSQEVIISSHNDLKVRFSYPHNFGQGYQETGSQECLAHIVNGKIIMTGELIGVNCNNQGFYDIQMIANQCFRMGNINDSTTNCKKTSIPPLAPSSLSATVSQGAILLSWSAGDNTEISYDIQRKSSATGEYSSISLPTTESYTDSTGIRTVTYWYRVFAKNTYGTSMGSNVISVVAQ